MRMEDFFEKFDLFADAPNAVAKTRELVLDLAITGRLVVPETEWPIRPLKSLATKIGSGATPAGGRESYFSEGVPLIRSMNVHFRGFDRTGLVFLSDMQAGQLSNVIVQAGDVLLNITGASIGRVTIAPSDMAGARVNQHVTIIRPTVELISSFLQLFLASPSVQRMIDEIQVGATRQALTKGMIEQFSIPVPPLAEQERIVAKVDELMALCDRLEAQQQERDTRHTALARASLARFAEAPTPANLDFLFHSSYPIAPTDLRKAILSLAVQGNLAAQDSNDEESSEILAAIDRDADKALRAKRMRKPKPITPHDNDLPFEVPYGWEWSQLGRLTAAEDNAMCDGPFGSKLKTEHYVDSRGYAVIRLGNIGVGKFIWGKEGNISRQHFEALSSNHIVPGDLLVAGLADPLVRCCEVPPDLGPAVNKADCFRVRLSRRMDRTYVRHYLNSPVAKAFAAEENHGMTRERINLGNAKALPVPVPPLGEQRRIVAKVDQLMAMVDQLEVQLAAAKAKSTALLDAIIHELLNPTAEIVDLAAYRVAIGCHTIRKMHDKPYFGRTAAMKALYLAQAHVGIELGLKPLRDAAGPLDKWIYEFEDQGKREDWFRVAESNTASGKKKIAYQPGCKLAEQCAQAGHLLSDKQRKEFDRLLGLLGDKTTEEAEIIATLFAAWNDFLIDGRSPSDDEIVTEVRENWHERKARFAPTLLRQWLGWLRQNYLIPQGRLPHTLHQQQLSLN